ncbi:MAG TPA: ferrous iron transport protein A [Desulfobacteraceae bacterium]|nr:ferrous iron transport protein A [Desulfobacteraceae bacterium]
MGLKSNYFSKAGPESKGCAKSLAAVQIGKPVRFVGVDAGRGLTARLTAMGFVPGMEIQLLRSCRNGPFLVEVMGARMMLGREMGQKIIVE